MKATQVGVIVKESTAFPRGMALMNNWIVGDENLGRASDWGPETLFVVDTITGLGSACMHFATDKLKIEDDWRATGGGMKLQGKYIEMLKGLKCHVIVFSHIRFMGGGGQVVTIDKNHPGVISYKEVDSNADGTGYPSALGRILPTQVASHFNTQLHWRMKGSRREISTEPDEKLVLKVPFKMKSSMPQETGLVDVFEAYLGRD
jgi:hypothetical protein